MDKLLTAIQISELLQIKLATVYKWVHYGYIPCIKIGRLVRFKKEEIEKWVCKKAEVAG